MAHNCRSYDDVPPTITAATLTQGRAGTLAALRSMPIDADPAVRRAYERLYCAFDAALLPDTGATITDIATARARRLAVRKRDDRSLM